MLNYLLTFLLLHRKITHRDLNTLNVYQLKFIPNEV